jgi:hypothetical protein
METLRIVACIALVTPAVATAQYPRAVDVTPRTVVVLEPDQVVTSLRVCEARNDRLWDRKALIDEDRARLDREQLDIDRARARLDAEWSTLDRGDTTAVASYNARSRQLNEWVESHNRRVDELNGAVARLNANSRDLVAYCDNIYPAR